MPTNNIFQQPLVPVTPKTLSEERVFVYVPTATNDSPGIASFIKDDFVVNNGVVRLTWPVKEQIESLSDPLKYISRVKLLDNEFEYTNKEASVTNKRGDKYTSRTAEVKFNRKNRDAFTRPDFVMLKDNDFEQSTDENDYVVYTIKQNDPFETPSLVQLDRKDFKGSGDKNNIIMIRWPNAHELVQDSSSTNTNGFGLVRISQNSQEKGYLKYTDKGDIVFNTTALQDEPVVSVKPTYTGGDGFTSSDWVNGAGIAKRDEGYTRLAITKEAVGLSKVLNKSFDEYVYNDFGQDIKDHFNAKIDIVLWNEKFGDWSEPQGTTVQKVVTELRDKDASILDTIRTAHQFLGFFEDYIDLINTYEADQFTFGSLAYVNDMKSYWRVRATNVNKVIDRVPTTEDIYDDAKMKDSFRVADRTTGIVYHWNSSTRRFEEIPDFSLKWVDAVVANVEDISRYIASHAKEHFFDGFLLGCRESGRIQRYIQVTDGWEDYGTMYYEWADAYINTFAWNTFVETDPSVLRADGVPSVGTSAKWVNSDHVHPTDQTRLAKSVFDSTSIKVTSEYTGLDSDFTTTGFTGGGEKTVNIPHIRKAIGWHNWQGSPSMFTDIESNQKYMWYGTSEQFESEKEDIKDDTLIFVDDSDISITSDIVTEDELFRQGVYIGDDSTDRIITVSIDDVDSLTGVPVTLEKYHDNVYQRDAYRLKKIDLGTQTGNIVVTSLIDSKMTLSYSNPGRYPNEIPMVYNTNGTLAAYHTAIKNFLKSAQSYELKFLPKDRLLKSGGENVVTTFDSGDIEGRAIVSNGLDGVMLQTFDYPGSVLFANGNNVIEETTIHHDNLIVSGSDIEEDGSLKVTILDTHKLVITSDTDENTISTFDTGTVTDKMLVSDGIGAVKVSDISANKLLYTRAQGVAAAFPMTKNDYNKVLAVDIEGYPTLIPLPTVFDNPLISKIDSLDWSESSSGIGNYEWILYHSDNIKYVDGYIPVVNIFDVNNREIFTDTKIEYNGDLTVYSDARVSLTIVIH